MAWGGYYYFREVDSTSSVALRWAAQGVAVPLCVRAARQTGGRGKGGRAWFSEPGSLSFSLLVFPHRTSELQTLTLAVAREVSEAINDLTGLQTQVKWPNDVVVDTQKVAGILLETRWTGARATLSIGIGINCAQTSFPEEIQATARSLSQLTGASVDTDQLFLLSTVRIDALLTHFETGAPVLDDIATSCGTLGRQVAILTHQGVVEGTALAINAQGALVVLTSGGEKMTVQEGDLQYKI